MFPMKNTGKRKLLLHSLNFLIFALAMAACDTPSNDFNLQGHRGCRGLMPENSIPGFIRALEIGVQTLELDLAVSMENELIVSHEPWMSADICLDSLGNEFSENRAREFNLYRMTYAQIERFDCGSKHNPRYPQQENIRVAKPRLSDLIDTVHAHCEAHNIPLPDWNIEIKSRPEWDHYYHPEPAEFARLVHALIAEKDIRNRSIVQSFDIRTLKAYHKLNPDAEIALLIDNDRSPQANLDLLGFQPAIYSPYYILVTPDLVHWCHNKGMRIYPWTVNEISDMRKMIDYGVDGLITDYPDRYYEAIKR